MPDWNWGESQSEDGVVHQSRANTDHNDSTALKQGYDYANFSEITPNPVACWPLHEDSGTTAYDVAGANDGTINGATVGQTGLLGTTGYSFDGADDYVTTPLNFSDYSTGITVLAWCYLPTVDTNDIQRVMSSRGPDKGDYNFFRLTDGKVSFGTYGGNTIYQSIGSTVAPESAWFQMAGSYDGSEYRTYLNGSLDDTTASTTWVSTTADEYIGARNDQNDNTVTNYTQGDIADVRIYNTALSQSQIQTLYDVVATQGTWTGTAKPL